ncbi:MAG: glycosyltransferase, partial [Candidatus Sungbacteria bacterium]|nr:glycosyltransferase [Candidatus Sungbacteria bacterium]
MIPQIRKTFVITVHFGLSQKTDTLLASLMAGKLVPDRVVVIDHAPTPYQPQTSFPNVTIVRPEANKGYAAGINSGLGWLLAKGAGAHDIVICLNNDAEVSAQSLEKIQAWVGQGQHLIAGPTSGIVNLLTGRARLVVGKLPSVAWHEAAYIHGSCLAGSFQTFLDAKPLPENFFLYWEDVAFSAQTIASGAHLAIIPGLGIAHPDKRHTPPTQIFYLVRNGAWYLENQTPPLWRTYWYVGNRLRALYHAWKGNKHILSALSAARKNQLGRLRGSEFFETAEATEASVGAVVVTHNNATTINACLDSLISHGIQDIIVVDNNSTDHTREKIDAYGQPHVHLIKNSRNQGFASACNQGAAILKNDVVLFINPDAQLQTSLDKGLEIFKQHPRLGILGLGLYDKVGNLEPHSFGPEPTLANLFLRQVFSGPKSYKLKATSYPDWVSAAAMLVRKQAFEQLAGFDAGFFMYWEDVDLCKRA